MSLNEINNNLILVALIIKYINNYKTLIIDY